jgi:SPP1 gp7 family putative phage head morphogenesis protein
MAKTSTYWDNRALKRLNDSEKLSETYINRVKKIYNQAYKDINRELASVYRNYSKETGLDIDKLKELLTRSETKKTWEQMKRQGLDKYIKDNYKSRISRLEQLQAQVYAKAKLIYPKEELENTMCYKGVINQSYYKTMYDTQMGTGFGFDFATIDSNMAKALLQDPWSGKNYSQRIWGNTDILANSLSEILGGAMLSGQSLERTSKQIRDRFNVSKYYAERLIRTETNHFNNEADAMAYEEMGLDKYVFVATLDSRTSEICQHMDNKVFKYKERQEGVNFPPLHPNCRSKTRGYLGEEAEKNLQRRARNPITGKTELIPNMSYSDWIKRYSNYTENEKKSKITTQAVNWNNIKDKSYKEKCNKITNNSLLNINIYNISKRILSHRDNSLREDLYLLDYNNGTVLGKQTNMIENEKIIYNKSILKALKDNEKIVAIHNHPNSMPPSDKDINACLQNNYKFGIVIGHDGSIYTYNTKNMKKPIDERDYIIAIEKYTKLYYNNSYKGQLVALKELSKIYKFDFKEVL